MKSVSFYINYREIRAMLNLASTDECRFILNGINFEIKGKTILLIATDGTRLGVLKSAAEPIVIPEEPINFTVHRAQLETAAKRGQCNKQGMLLFTVEQESSGHLPSVEIEGQNMSFRKRVIDGKFPNWRACVPEKFEDGPVTISIVLFDAFKRVSDALKSKSSCTRILGGKEGTAYRVHLEGVPNFFGILMPMRADPKAENLSTPGWLSV